MIENNVIKFGYGDIVVGYGDIVVTVSKDVFATALIFEQISPSLKCGTNLAGVEDNIMFGTTRVLVGNFEDLNELRKQLELVRTGEKRIITYEDCVFDFTNYHPASVEVLIQKVEAAIQKSLERYAV